MEVILIAFGVLAVLAILFLIVEHPFKIGSLLIFMMLYQFNLSTPLPLDSRGILTILLLLRLYFFDKENMTLVNTYLFQNKYFWLILAFIFMILILPIVESEKLIKFAKEIILAIVGIILGFILISKDEGKKSLAYGVIFAGIFSSIDIIFSFGATGGLGVIKVINIILNRSPEISNHNYPGFIASLGLFYVYLAWYRSKINKIVLTSLLILLSLGIFLSTSRSSLLAFVIIFIVASIYEHDLKQNLRKIALSGLLVAVSIVAFFFAYNILESNEYSNSHLDKIYYRLYEEPFEIFTGDKSIYDKYSGQKISGSMAFRTRRWDRDFQIFTELNVLSQMIGLGYNGHVDIAEKQWGKGSGHLQQQLSPHNGFLIILIDRGWIGLLLFIVIIISLTRKNFKNIKQGFSEYPFIYLLLMLAIYSVGQNSELTSAYAFFILGCVLGEAFGAKLDSEKSGIN